MSFSDNIFKFPLYFTHKEKINKIHITSYEKSIIDYFEKNISQYKPSLLSPTKFYLHRIITAEKNYFNEKFDELFDWIKHKGGTFFLVIKNIIIKLEIDFTFLKDYNIKTILIYSKY
jgi:hypothetical protein